MSSRSHPAICRSSVATTCAVNVGQTPHNLTIEEGGGRDEAGRGLVATSDLAADAMERLPVEVAPGEYTLVCTLPGHRDAGMVGKIVVE